MQLGRIKQRENDVSRGSERICMSGQEWEEMVDKAWSWVDPRC